jgi:hypothetical protein
MPKPFLELTLEQFAEMLNVFPWKRMVNDVHVHHTFRPNHTDFSLRPPIESIEGMFRFHTEERHFADIAQHVTIDPRGVIWTGRNWNMAPASATGFNGNEMTGPFMFEMIGNFDLGQDRWEGVQRETAIEVIARVQKHFGLSPTAFRFHHEMSPKSCPGTAIRKPDVLEAVEAGHERLAVPRAARRGAFDESASRNRATADRLLQLFDVKPVGAGSAANEAELPEADMSLREGEMSSGNRSAFRSTRDADTSDLTPEDFVLLRKHVINLRMGEFSSGGAFQTTAEDVTALFSEHLPRFLAERKQQNPDAKLKLVFFAHGGLNDEVQSLKNARNRVAFYLANRCYPVFFVWETGVKETLRDILGQIIGIGPGRGVADTLTNISDPILESAFGPAGHSMWVNMKLSAERAFLPKQGGTFLLQGLTEFWKRHSADMEVHAIGHSAGSIFLAQFISALCQQPSNPPTEVQSLHFLAPAITVELFKDTLKDLVGGRVKSLTQFTMAKDFELADSVGPYRKSLLYLVSRSFEDQPETPILGLEESLRRDPDMRDFFGLLGTHKRKAEILFSVREDGPSHSTISKKHGDFDNDRLTMSGVIRRILAVADDVPIVEFPETVSRSILDASAAVPAAPGPQTVAVAPFATAPFPAPAVVVRPAGRRRAVCVGVDEYDPPNRLAGCVNDATDWASALRGLGFETSLLLNRSATWQGIQDAMADLVTSSGPGDVVVFQYAGHGTRVPDIDGDEPSGRDSALCPIDFASGRLLIDDDVRRIFQRLPDGVNFTCFFDCCHSGTITRLVAPTPTSARGADVRSRGLRVTPEVEAAHMSFRTGRREAAPPPRGVLDMKEISFTACTDSQTAQEIDGHGQFTVRALTLLRQGQAGMTNGEFQQRVVTAFGAGSSDQTPQIDCAPAAKMRPLLAAIGGGVAAPSASPALESILARLADIDRRVSRLGV